MPKVSNHVNNNTRALMDPLPPSFQEEQEKQAYSEGSGETEVTTEDLLQLVASTEKMRITIDDSEALKKRSKYIPLRLNEEERKLFQILQGGLEVSEYTDHVDVSRHMYGGWGGYHSLNSGKKEKIIKRELTEMMSFLSGLYVVSNQKNGHKLVLDQEFEENEEFFQKIFEIGRRYKIMNPDKMRTTYGKLMYMMMDAMKPSLINMDVYSPISCVYDFLEEKDGLALLDDPEISLATRCVVGAEGDEIKKESDIRAAARASLVSKYSSDKLTEANIRVVFDSLADSNTYILANRHPVDRMIYYLKKYFDPRSERGYSLAIRSGSGGSCLSHSHATQFTFVLQSLELWREIQHEMFKLWIMSDDDLLSDSGSYRLVDTGQGLNRMKGAPRVGSTMSKILTTVKHRVGSWVGLSVVHLGDRDVPNPLVFIDKYTQVPRILTPIVNTIERLHVLINEPALELFIQQYGGLDHVVKLILRDFFRHGFDGSGDDGGSCIDGRLTSAWNWCSQIEKKEYYPVFLLTGFYGFDGDFRK